MPARNGQRAGNRTVAARSVVLPHIHEQRATLDFRRDLLDGQVFDLCVRVGHVVAG